MAVFAERVYALLRTVPRGKVTTYRELAEALGTRAYRAVGQALRCNPYAPRTPCHRVVSTDGRIGGFHGATEGPQVRRKVRLLAKEGVRVERGRIRGFERSLYRFTRRP
jgi:methylated-DNA-[protein]-cysteine S-methyltransferase